MKFKAWNFFHSTIARFARWIRSGAFDFEVAVSAVFSTKCEKRKTYQKWSTQERFTIEKYAAINDPDAAAKKIGSKARAVNESTVRGFCAMCKAELEKSRKKARPIAPNLNALPTERLLFVGKFRSNDPKVFIGSPK